MVRRQGIEPRLSGPKPDVLPLDDLRIFGNLPINNNFVKMCSVMGLFEELKRFDAKKLKLPNFEGKLCFVNSLPPEAVRVFLRNKYQGKLDFEQIEDITSIWKKKAKGYTEDPYDCLRDAGHPTRSSAQQRFFDNFNERNNAGMLGGHENNLTRQIQEKKSGLNKLSKPQQQSLF